VDVTSKIRVSFAGQGSGTAELSWGQQTVWRGIEDRGAVPIILAAVEALPPGTALDDEARKLEFIMSRNQSLRTRFTFPQEGAPPRQVVYGSGEIFLEVVDAADDEDPREVAAAVQDRLEYSPRDYENEWPVRMAVIRHKGALVYEVSGICHSCIDGFGGRVMRQDLADRDPGTGQAKAPKTAMEPIEQARWQASPAGERQNQGAERHWRKVLSTIPARRFRQPDAPHAPRYWTAKYRSRAAQLAAQVVAAHAAVDTTPVLLAAFATGMARVSGSNPVVPRVFVSNRFRPRFATTISPVSQTCPCVVDVAGVTFDEAVRRASRAAVAAYKNAYFEPARIRAVLASVIEERGEDIDVGCVYNDRRADTLRLVTSPLPELADIKGALAGTELSWEQSDEPLDLCHIHILNSADALDVLIFFDTGYVAPQDVEGMLRTVEEIMVAAASSPSTPTGV
jgi:Condensation domain